MSVSSKGCNFEHTKLSGIKTKACLLAAESVSFKIDHPCLKQILFQYLKVNLQPRIF